MSDVIGSWRDFPEKRVFFHVKNDITQYLITFTEEISDLERGILHNTSHDDGVIYIHVWVVPLIESELTQFSSRYDDDFLLFGTDHYQGCIAGSQYTGECHSGFTPKYVFDLLANITFEEDRPPNILSLATAHYNHHYQGMPASGAPLITIGIETYDFLQARARQAKEDSETPRVSLEAITASSVGSGYNASESGLED